MNNFFGGNNGNFNGNFMGTTYGNPQMRPTRPVPKNTQPLTKEQQNALIKKAPKFNTQISETELFTAWCTHRHDNGSALVMNGDGTYTCSICGETINLKSYTDEQVKQVVDEFINLVQVTKAFYVDIPDQVAREMYQILPLCKRIPMLYKLAFNNYERYYGQNGFDNGMNNMYDNGIGAWNSFDQFTSNGFGNMGNVAYTPNMANQPEAYMGNQVYSGMGNPQFNGGYPQQHMNNFMNQQQNMLAGNNGENPFYSTANTAQQQNPDVKQPEGNDNGQAKVTQTIKLHP